jgi:hypothetical protein
MQKAVTIAPIAKNPATKVEVESSVTIRRTKRRAHTQGDKIKDSRSSIFLS